MATRITGLATGLDIDTIVKQTMQAYQSKIDVQKQKKDILEIKQQLYRDIIKEAQELYNKHFDVLKEGSLIKGSTWQSVKFTSSSNNLTVTGTSSTKAEDYTIQAGSTIAKAANTTRTEKDLGSEIIINGQKFTVTGSTAKEKVDNLNKELTKAGINVSVRYTNFLGQNSTDKTEPGFVFESKILGESGSFFIGGGIENTSKGTGTDATAAVIQTNLTVKDLKDNINEKGMISFKIGSTTFDISITGDESENKNIEDSLNRVINNAGYTAKIEEDGSISFITNKTGKGQKQPTVEFKYKSVDADGEEYSNIFKEFKDGEDAKPAELDITSQISSSTEKIVINGVYIDLSQKGSSSEVDYINSILKNNKVSVEVEKSGDKTILKSTIVGSNSNVEFSILNSGVKSEEVKGENANIIIKNSEGKYYTYTGDSNTFTVDDITFKFTGAIPSGGIEITSSKDSSKISENIKKYIEDYNALITKINTLTSEKRARDYQPLTDSQKEEMSDKEIELWESKVKQGQLSRDSDLMRISNALKQGMINMVSGTGLTLDDIGIESVQDYGGTKDGTFKIDETKLNQAIENNTEEVAKLFTQVSTNTSTNSYNEKGIMMRLKEILYDETVSSKSTLAKKVGFEGTVTVVDNELNKQMEEYQKKITQMKTLFSTKEQQLYNKYAKLESIMNSYNSQMSYLSQSLGLG